MNISDAFMAAQQRCKPTVPEYITGILDASHNIEMLDTGGIEFLWIKHDYKGAIPELSLFPKLKVFSCNQAVTADYLRRQDCTRLTRISIFIENCPSTIQLYAPHLKKLYIHVMNNKSDQIDMFCLGPKSIDLSFLPSLEEIELRHCTGFDIVINRILPLVKKAVYADCRYESFCHLQYMPNLERLFIVDSKVPELSFLKYCPNVEYIDLTNNEIKDCKELLSMPRLQKAILHKNPLIDPDSLPPLVSSVLVYGHDKDINSFQSELSLCANNAYMMVMKDRKPNKQRPAYFQHIIDSSTDEELFARHLETLIWGIIENAIHGKQSLLYKSVTPEEMLIQTVQEYPFIGNSLAKRFNNTMNQ